MDSFIQVYGTESNYLDSEGDTLSKEETEEYIREYIEKSGFSDLINIRFSAK